MEIYALKKPDSYKKRKRIGCGNSSGHGKTSTKGSKGQKARSGVHLRPGFEGGQMPLHRRIPKRGFTNNFRTEYQIVNVNQLDKISGGDITVDVLKKSGIVKSAKCLVKIVGNGNITKA
ncbi:MAG: 50S ribosomal protein L15, partial [Spirochaetota bacterium]